MAKATMKQKAGQKNKPKTTTKPKAKSNVKPKATAAKKAAREAKVEAAVKLPDLALEVTGGQTVNLARLRGKKVVLYFYPKDMTPGCTLEGHEFSNLGKEFAARNAVVYGVSRDTVALHEKFKAKECYSVDLISDVDEKLCKAFRVIKDKNMYGRIVKGIERSTFLIDENGQVKMAWRGVKAEGHAAQVLEYLKS